MHEIPRRFSKWFQSAAAWQAQVSKEAAEAAEAAKGSYGFGIGEEWLTWLPVTWGLRDFADALDAGGAPAPNAVTQRPDGQWVVDTFPLGCARVLAGHLPVLTVRPVHYASRLWGGWRRVLARACCADSVTLHCIYMMRQRGSQRVSHVTGIAQWHLWADRLW